MIAQGTNLAYLNNSYTWNSRALVSHITASTLPAKKISGGKNIDKAAFTVVVDETLFYPQGGGQPSDKGQIVQEKDGGNITFLVEHVTYNDGIVEHHGYFEGGMFDVGQEVVLKVDSTYRLLNSRLHTAGHLIFSMIKELALPLTEKKGYHFVDGPYVEFSGTWPKELTRDTFEGKIGQAIAQDFPVVVKYKHKENDTSEVNPMRYVTIGKFVDSPCGGTHVKSLSELGSVVVRKIKSSKGTTKISYSVIF